MHWVIQRDLHSRDNLQSLMEALDRFGCHFTLVDIVDGVIQPDLDFINPVICLGANSVASIAQDKGWLPGCFVSNRIRYEDWLDGLGNELLNSDGKICRLADIPLDLHKFFLRPTIDSKTFTGRIFDQSSFRAWKNASAYAPDTAVVYAAPKEIAREYRFFVVADEIVTGSVYRQGGKAYFSAEIEPEVYRYAEKIIHIWSPSKTYVLDIALTGSEQLKVIEYNGLAAARFYNADILKLVAALLHRASELYLPG